MEIDVEKYYAASEARIKFFPWIKSHDTFRRWLKSPKGQELLKPVIRAAGKKTRYFIKGEFLAAVHKLAEEGNLKI